MFSSRDVVSTFGVLGLIFSFQTIMDNILYSVCISTWKPEGIRRVYYINLPILDSTEYVVSWQAHENAQVPAELAKRNDVRIFRFGGRGISANRNNALSHARGLVSLTADDDLVYDASFLKGALSKALDLEAPALAVFSYDGPDAPLFPQKEMILERTLPKGFITPAFVIALRRAATNNPWPLMFDLRFGPGSTLGLDAAEDEMIVLAARKKKIPRHYFPIKICTHPGLSTGHRRPTPGVLRSSGVYIAKEYPLTALPRIILKAYRLRRKYSVGFLATLRPLLRGYLKSFRIKL